jgi:hypothetical protein
MDPERDNRVHFIWMAPSESANWQRSGRGVRHPVGQAHEFRNQDSCELKIVAIEQINNALLE